MGIFSKVFKRDRSKGINVKPKKKITKDDPKTLKKKLENTLQTTTKQLIWLFSLNGVAWIWCSYILAFLGRDQIAEALSTNVCTVIIGQMVMYVISKTIENIFKYNEFERTGISDETQLNQEGIYHEQQQYPGEQNQYDQYSGISPDDFA